MDPDKCLEELRGLVCELAERYDFPLVVDELLERITALDGWLSEGGFLPKDWQK